jgi:hypothetical protein
MSRTRTFDSYHDAIAPGWSAGRITREIEADRGIRFTFNGVSAAFKILNVNFLIATVPAGATTGPIAVTNPGGRTVSSVTKQVEGAILSGQAIEKNGGDDGTRTRDLCRDRAAF